MTLISNIWNGQINISSSWSRVTTPGLVILECFFLDATISGSERNKKKKKLFCLKKLEALLSHMNPRNISLWSFESLVTNVSLLGFFEFFVSEMIHVATYEVQ